MDESSGRGRWIEIGKLGMRGWVSLTDAWSRPLRSARARLNGAAITHTTRDNQLCIVGARAFDGCVKLSGEVK